MQESASYKEKDAKYHTYGARLREARKNSALNQQDFALLGDVSKRTQASYEKGEAAPNAEYLDKISKIGADVNYIVTGNRSHSVEVDSENFSAENSGSYSAEAQVMDWEFYFYILNELDAVLKDMGFVYDAGAVGKFSELIFTELTNLRISDKDKPDMAKHEIKKTIALLEATEATQRSEE